MYSPIRFDFVVMLWYAICLLLTYLLYTNWRVVCLFAWRRSRVSERDDGWIVRWKSLSVQRDRARCVVLQHQKFTFCQCTQTLRQTTENEIVWWRFTQFWKLWHGCVWWQIVHRSQNYYVPLKICFYSNALLFPHVSNWFFIEIKHKEKPNTWTYDHFIIFNIENAFWSEQELYIYIILGVIKSSRQLINN